MPNTDLFIMSKGSKPGDTPSTSNENVYYDCPTNPLIICDDLENTGIYVNGTAATGSAYITVDNGSGSAPTNKYIKGDAIYIGGTFIGTFDYFDTVNNRFYLESVSAATATNNLQLQSFWNSTNANRIVCYEITENDPFAPTNAADDGGSTGLNGGAEYGVSQSNQFTHLNRYFPSSSLGSATQISSGFGENRELTEGYRIEMDVDADGSQLLLSGSLINTVDYFVMIFADDHLKHHFAKITEITSSDATGDSFEFSPTYSGQIPKGTKYAIYKGPLVSETSVVALAYGLEGNGYAYSADTDNTDGAGYARYGRHNAFTYVARPLFYFYNDRLDKPNQLDHNKKYTLHSSRSDGSTEKHYQRCFVTEQDYGKRIVDYSKYETYVSLVDNLRTADKPNSSAASQEQYNSDSSYTMDVSDWDDCFRNIRRNENDLKHSTMGTNDEFNGPIRYLHYTDSPQKVNAIPHVINLEVFESVTKTGTFMNLDIIDPKRIYGKKIKSNDRIESYKMLSTGNISNNYDALIYGTVTGTTSSTTLTFSGLEDGQDLRLLLQSSSSFETIRIGRYVYRITAVGAPSTSAGTQTITIDAYKLTSAGSFTTGISGAAETLTDANAFRRAWSPLTKTLMVEFNIDTIADYSGTSITAVNDSLVTLKVGNASISPSSSKLYKTQICLLGGPYNGKRFAVSYGDQKNSFVKLQSPRTQLYLDESSTTENYLAYYIGEYVLEKKVFSGYAEFIEDYIEDGQYKYRIKGRNEIGKLLGPIVNKNYKHSEDIIYSTVGPYLPSYDGTTVIVSANSDEAFNYSLETVGGTILEAGDYLWTTDGDLIGEVLSVDDTSHPQGVKLLDGMLTSTSSTTIRVSKPTTNGKIYSFSKAMSSSKYSPLTPTSLDSTAGKGLFFTAGNKIVDGVESSSLLTTSIYRDSSDNEIHRDAVGYPIKNPRAISTSILARKEGDSAFMGALEGSIGGTTYRATFDTPSSVPNFAVTSVSSDDGKGLITLAPISPIVLARADMDGRYTKPESLTDSGITFAADDTSLLSYDAQQVLGTFANIPENEFIYNADGVTYGKVVNKFKHSAGNQFIVLDRNPNEEGISTINAGDKIYTIANRKNHNISFLNTHGIDNGAVLQLMSQVISPAGNSIMFNHYIKDDNTSTNDYGNTTFLDRFGGYQFRVYDIHKNPAGSLYKVKRHSFGDISNRTESVDTYAEDTGNLLGFGRAYRTKPILITGTDMTIDTLKDNDEVNEKIKQIPPEMREALPLRGSNFEDYDKYIFANSSGITVDGALAKHANATITTDADATSKFSVGDFVYNANGELLGMIRTVSSTSIVLYDTIRAAVADGETLMEGQWGVNNQALIEVYPKFSLSGGSAHSNGIQGDWAFSESGGDHSGTVGQHIGWKTNAIKRAKDHWEILDPKTVKYYLFGQSDLYPDCANRKNNLLYGTRTITDYNLLLKSKGTQEISSESPDKYKGSAFREVLKDDNYETQTIESSNKTLSELRRYNMMRLIEVTYDSHFNLLDPEIPPAEDSGSGSFKYTTYSVIEKITGSSTDPYITAWDSATVLSVTGDFNNLANGDYIYGYNGVYLGRIHTSAGLNTPSSGKITLNSDGEYNRDGERYLGPIYKVEMGIGGGGSKNFQSFTTMGNAGKQGAGADTNRLLNLTQGKVFGRNGAVRLLTNFQKSQILAGEDIELPWKTLSIHNTNSGETIASSTSSHVTRAGSVNLKDIFRIGDGVFSDDDFLGRVDDVENDKLSLLEFDTSATNGETLRKYDSMFSSTIGKYHPSFMLRKMSEGQLSSHLFSKNEVNPWYFNRVVILSGYKTTPEPEKIDVAPGMNISVDKKIRNKNDGKKTSSFGDNSEHNCLYLDSEYGFAHFDLEADAAFSTNKYKGSGAYFVFKPVLHLGSGSSIAQTGSNCGRIMDEHFNQDIVSTKTSGTTNTSSYGGTINVDSTTGFASAGDAEVGGRTFTYTGKSGTTFTGCSGLAGGLTIPDDTLIIGGTKRNTLLISINNAHPAEVQSSGNSWEVNHWLDFVPNLTGYYLVSSRGVITDEITTATSLADSNVRVGVSSGPFSSAEICPEDICYIISHTKKKDTLNSSGITHHILIDAPPGISSSDLDSTSFRVMRPAEVCTYPTTSKKLKLYNLSSKTTKMPFQAKMYSNIPNYAVVQRAELSASGGGAGAKISEPLTVSRLGEGSSNYGKYDFNEGILSMYVIIDPDNRSDSNYLIPRDPTKLFGTDSQPLKDGNYEFVLTDGNETITRTLTFSSPKSSGFKDFTVTFNKDLPKMVGAVSMGTPFTIVTSKASNLRDVQTAKIGSTLTICSETEDILNDVLETNKFTYTRDTLEYPKYFAPNFQGVDVFSAADYLAKLKQKRLFVDLDTVVLEKKEDVNIRFTPVVISDISTDINLISVKKTDSAFEFYNHVTVYGRGIKSTARDPKSIKKIGKKSLEEFDNALTTLSDVNEKAKELLQIHSSAEQTIQVETGITGVEYVKAGDIVTVELINEGIPRQPFKVLEIYHSSLGKIRMNLGSYSKGMEHRIADLLAQNKLTTAFLRNDDFKGNTITNELLDTIKIKPLKLLIKKTTTTATGTFIGFTTPINIGTATMGFTGSASTTVTLLEKDL